MLIKASYVLWLQLLADGVIPNEYGINPQQKLKIGSKVGFSTWNSNPQRHIMSNLSLMEDPWFLQMV